MWKSASVAPCFWEKINLWRAMKNIFIAIKQMLKLYIP